MSGDFVNLLADLKEEEVLKLTQKRLDSKEDPLKILEDARKGMEIVGKRFAGGEYFLPELVFSGELLTQVTNIVKPHLTGSGAKVKKIGKVVIGTVKGDLHDIGKNIVSMMLKGACFEVADLGIDVPIEKFVEAAEKSRADLIAMSSLLTTSMNAMRDTINALKAGGIRDKVKVMVGGAPITQDFANSIGADAYAKDAATAVDMAKELIKEVK